MTEFATAINEALVSKHAVVILEYYDSALLNIDTMAPHLAAYLGNSVYTFYTTMGTNSIHATADIDPTLGCYDIEYMSWLKNVSGCRQVVNILHGLPYLLPREEFAFRNYLVHQKNAIHPCVTLITCFGPSDHIRHQINTLVGEDLKVGVVSIPALCDDEAGLPYHALRMNGIMHQAPTAMSAMADCIVEDMATLPVNGRILVVIGDQEAYNVGVAKTMLIRSLKRQGVQASVCDDADYHDMAKRAGRLICISKLSEVEEKNYIAFSSIYTTGMHGRGDPMNYAEIVRLYLVFQKYATRIFVAQRQAPPKARLPEFKHRGRDYALFCLYDEYRSSRLAAVGARIASEIAMRPEETVCKLMDYERAYKDNEFIGRYIYTASYDVADTELGRYFRAASPAKLPESQYSKYCLLAAISDVYAPSVGLVDIDELVNYYKKFVELVFNDSIEELCKASHKSDCVFEEAGIDPKSGRRVMRSFLRINDSATPTHEAFRDDPSDCIKAVYEIYNRYTDPVPKPVKPVVKIDALASAWGAKIKKK